VVGAELSRIAIDQLFQELEVAPQITKTGPLEKFSAENLDIFAGDLFELDKGLLGPVDVIYDRAALVALPPEMRVRYTTHLMTITDKAPQLLICYEYDQTLVPGPPFSVSREEVQRHYQGPYQTALLASDPVPGGLRGKVEAKESIWLLKRS
jgi:thiopurine S-methyltransferase